jgi:L-lactate dehydrogenase complex protein LldE
MTVTRVQLLVTCLIDRLYPDTGMAAVSVLERLGLEVICPERQTCCGQPAFNGGFRDDARAMARRTIDLFSRDDAPVVIASGSCGDMVIHQYADLLADEPDYKAAAKALAARTWEFTQFLVDQLGVTDVGAAAPAGTISYHAACHGLRGLQVRDQPMALLQGIEGAQLTPLPEHDVCCGFGGLFSVKMAEISTAMLARKLDCIEQCGARTIAVTDVSCAMHMAGGLRRRGSPIEVRHIADLLAPERTR